MKKTNFYVSSIFILVFIFVSQGCSSSKSVKSSEDQVEAKVKEWKSEGWKIEGSRTLSGALTSHYSKLEKSEENKEMIGYVSICKSMNVCKQNALNNVINEYASTARSSVKGRIESDLQNNQSIELGEFDKMYAAYESLVEKEIGGAFVKSFSIVKDNGSSKSYQSYYILNESNASQARINALKLAFEETKIAQQYAREISNFVNEGFELKKKNE